MPLPRSSIRLGCPSGAGWPRTAVAVAVFLVASLGACGGEDAPENGEATPSPTAAGDQPTVVPTSTLTPTDTPEPTTVPTNTATPEPSGPGSVTGTIVFNGRPISLVTAARARFGIQDSETYEEVEAVKRYEPETGSFELKGLDPGEYRIFAWVDAAAPEGDQTGGDYYSGLSGWSPVVSISEESPTARADVPVVQIIHLTFPVDNSERRTAVGDPPESVLASAASTYIWDPVPGAARYVVRILELETATGTSLGGPWMNVTEPSATFEPPLSPSMEGHHYGFLVEAYNQRDELVGVFRHFYTNGNGGWFYFRAVSASQ